MFSVSPTSVQYPSIGRSNVFIIKTNSSWKISKYTHSWGHLVKSGNTITLRVDANTGQSSRSDYFELISGERIIRVSILQAGEESQSGESIIDVQKRPCSYDFICKRLLTESDIIGLLQKELRIMRN